MRLSRISWLFRPSSAEAKLRRITLAEVWIILISCVSRTQYNSFIIRSATKTIKSAEAIVKTKKTLFKRLVAEYNLLYIASHINRFLPLSNGYIALNQTVILFTLLSSDVAHTYCCTRSGRATKQFEIMTYVISCRPKLHIFVKINFLNLITYK